MPFPVALQYSNFCLPMPLAKSFLIYLGFDICITQNTMVKGDCFNSIYNLINVYENAKLYLGIFLLKYGALKFELS